MFISLNSSCNLDGSASYDPYDLWATASGLNIRKRFYEGGLTGKAGAALFSLMDWVMPSLSRTIVGVSPRLHPITIAHLLLISRYTGFELQNSSIDILKRLASKRKSSNTEWSWGLGFPWMSKNGLYDKDMPFVTHTPYVMEALLFLSAKKVFERDAMEMFNGTWSFLESLQVKESGVGTLALSYAPVSEPRIVINANAYASFAYALHSKYGRKDIREVAKAKAIKIANWVLSQQDERGAWFYYADKDPGNFIDCFHSCFVLKNLIKASELIVDIPSQIAVEKGFYFLKEGFYDSASGVCKRFYIRDIKDPYKWDLYDQAEFLGMLIDLGKIEEARSFHDSVKRIFNSGDDWWCKIDLLGRRWGKNLLRWGIAPFWYNSARLENIILRKEA